MHRYYLFYPNRVYNYLLKSCLQLFINVIVNLFLPFLFSGFASTPYLILRVRREEIVHDALRKVRRNQRRQVNALLRVAFAALPMFYSVYSLVFAFLFQLTATVSESELRKPLKVVFGDEEGVDEGGVTKEFFQLLVEKVSRVMSNEYTV